MVVLHEQARLYAHLLREGGRSDQGGDNERSHPFTRRQRSASSHRSGSSPELPMK